MDQRETNGFLIFLDQEIRKAGSQSAFAKKIGITKAPLCRLMGGKVTGKRLGPTILKISEAYSITPSAIRLMMGDKQYEKAIENKPMNLSSVNVIDLCRAIAERATQLSLDEFMFLVCKQTELGGTLSTGLAMELLEHRRKLTRPSDT
jgi:hypothetical protein